MRQLLMICIVFLLPFTCQAEEAPDFTWQGLDGSHHMLSEFAGRAVVIHFWASWCVPCRAEFPALLARAQKSPSLIFLTISSDEDKALAQKFIHHAQHAAGDIAPANVLYAWDPQKAITFDVFQTVQYPETILLDSKHNMRRKFAGPVDWNSEATNAIVQALP